MDPKPKLLRITTVPQSLYKLLEGQLEYMSMYFDVFAVSSPTEDFLKRLSERENVSTYAISMKRGISPIKDLIAIYKMCRYIAKIKPDIVHTHTPKAGLVGIIAARLMQVPVRLHTVAGLPLETRQGFKKKLLLLVEKIIYKNTTKVYPNSRGLYKFILENNLAKERKLKIIGKGSSNGINLEVFTENAHLISISEDLKIKHKISSSDFVFLFIGRIVRDKGIEELLLAFDNLSSTQPNTKLVILGRMEPDLDPISKNALDILDSNKDIILPGYQKDIRPYLSMSDAFVFPTYREGLPNVLLQAQSFSMPCVVTRVNGNTDIVEEGVNGVFVDRGNSKELLNAMLLVRNNHELRDRISNNARKVIEKNYDQKYLWKELLSEYQSFLGKK